ncbi:hypothetical protein AGMMS49992_24340 [Clostridia bacterium]|nr:hypothetical protein AGMMS49992_24340 [Clostridia bacterium]
MAAHRRGYVIAIDFDGTLCSDAYPDIGNAREAIIKLAKEAQRYGANIVLWTCREGDLLNEALTWCKKHGLQFAAVNDNIPARIALWGNNSRKPVWEHGQPAPTRDIRIRHNRRQGLSGRLA